MSFSLIFNTKIINRPKRKNQNQKLPCFFVHNSHVKIDCHHRFKM